MTVAQLQDVLTGLHSSRKSDEQIATQLKQIELTEELTGSAMNRMANLVNGQLSTEQMYVLEARSCILAPPDTDLPKALLPAQLPSEPCLPRPRTMPPKPTLSYLDHSHSSRRPLPGWRRNHAILWWQ